MDMMRILTVALPPSLRIYTERIQASPLYTRMLRGAFWSVIGMVSSRVLTLAATILSARRLGKEIYGELAIVIATVATCQVLAGLGTGLTATKHIAEFRANDPAKAGRIMALCTVTAGIGGLLMSLILLLFAPWIAERALGGTHLSETLKIGSFLLLLGSLGESQTGMLAGFESFKALAIANIVSGIASFPLIIGGVYWFGLNGALWGMAASAGITCAINYFALRYVSKRAGVELNFKGCFQEWRILRDFSGPASLAGAIVAPVNWICTVILVNRMNGYSELGIYNAANQWFMVLMFLPGILGQVTLPMLAERLGQNDRKGLAEILKISIWTNAIAVVPLVALASVGSSFLMRLFGNEFQGEWPTLITSLITAATLCVQIPVGQLIAATGHMWTGFLMNLAWGTAFVIASYFLVSNGAVGIAAARLIAYGLHAIWTFGFAFFITRRHRETISYE